MKIPPLPRRLFTALFLGAGAGIAVAALFPGTKGERVDHTARSQALPLPQLRDRTAELKKSSAIISTWFEVKEKEEEKAAATIATSRKKQPDTPLQLLGFIVQSGTTFALIRHSGKNERPGRVPAGGKLPGGGILKQISNQSIIVEEHGHTRTIELYPAVNTSPPSPEKP